MESCADWELMECHFDYKLVLWDAQAADGGKSSIPVHLNERGIGPVVSIK
jgi:hypothetical protein